MYNKRVLSKIDLGKYSKPNPYSKDIITDPMGQWKYPGIPTRIPSSDITMQGVGYPVLGVADTGQTQMMVPGTDYTFPGANYVDEYPQAKKGGLVKMPKPSKKGLASKKFTNSVMGTSRLFTESPLFAKSKKKKNRIFDPNAKYYQDGGITTQEEIDAANNAMMKARLAYAQMHGNPAAQRMIVAPDQPYDFGDGNMGTHYMASMDEYAVPQIQDVDGQLMLGDYGPESSEAIRLDNPEDAMYFAEHYKDIAPAFIETELTPEEIEEYRRGGFIVEDISVPQLTMQDGGEPKRKKTKFVPGTYDPAEMAGYMLDEQEVVVPGKASNWGKARTKYKERHPEEEFVEKKKKQYLKKNPGLNKVFGVSMENFPQYVEENFRNEYDYKTNTAVVKDVSRKEGWNPNKRTEYVDELNDTQRSIVANSKFGSKLQPNYWDRGLAGVATLVSPFSSGVRRMMNEGYMPGLTKKESRAILNQKTFGIPTGGLEVFTPLAPVGQTIANYVKNTGLSTGSDYKDIPWFASGESMSNVTDLDTFALDPFQVAGTISGVAAVPSMVTKAIPTIKKAAENLSELRKFASDTDVPLELPGSVNSNSNIIKKGIRKTYEKMFPYSLTGTRSNKELQALTSLELQSLSESKLGQDAAMAAFDDFKKEKLMDLDTVEGRRRVKKYIDDNQITEKVYDPGNYGDLLDEADQTVKVNSPEVKDFVKTVRERAESVGVTNPSDLGYLINSWDDFTPEFVTKNSHVRYQLLNDMVLKNPKFTGMDKDVPIDVDKYIQKISGMRYDDVESSILNVRKDVGDLATSIRYLKDDQRRLTKALDDGKIEFKDYIPNLKKIRDDLKNLEDKKNIKDKQLTNLEQYLNVDNAYFTQNANQVFLGNPYTTVGDLKQTMMHEGAGHGLNTAFLGKDPVQNVSKNSVLDKELIQGIDLKKTTPKHLLKRIDVNEVQSATPYKVTRLGIQRAKYPRDYFLGAKDYFLKGSTGKQGMSREPVAFAAEVRNALREDNIISSDYDNITPEMLKQQYEEYIKSPLYERNLRLFDIMKPNQKSFKTLSKVLNNMKVVAPYAVPVGIGAAAVGSGEELQEEMEYQDGGIITELSDKEISEYQKGGWIVEEL
jgi:hypothetical protein